MRIKDKLGGFVSTFDVNTAPTVPLEHRARSAPVRLADFSKEFKEQERRLIELEAEKGTPVAIPLDLLDDSPYQVRPLSLETVQYLAENLRENPLATPIICRKVEGGRYEIIAGHHRKLAFEKLGRTEIPGVVLDYDDDQTERALVFDNLVRSELADFYRFKSLLQLRDRHGWNGLEISERSGMSKSQVYALMAFEKLPEEVLSIVAQHPDQFGANLVGRMVSSKKNPAVLAELSKRVAEGHISPAAAMVALKVDESAAKPTAAPAALTEVRIGKAKVAISSRGNSFSVKLPASLADKNKADAFNSRLADLVKEIFG